MTPDMCELCMFAGKKTKGKEVKSFINTACLSPSHL